MEQLYAAMRRLARSPAFKFVLVCFLVLVLLIPLALVFGLVMEREGRAREVQRDVARTWGSVQQITGPFLIVPYTVRLETVQGDKRVEQLQERRAVFLPEKVDFRSTVASKVLRRSIYEVVVYTAQIAVEGRFLAPDMAEAANDAVSVRWADAVLALGISDVAGLRDAASLSINGQIQLAFAPSIGAATVQQNGIHVKLAGAGEQILAGADAPLKPFNFRFELTFGGSSSLEFAPVARETTASMTSDWPHPSFSGSFLPVDRSIAGDGFTASWRVPHLARSVPQAWSLVTAGLDRFRPYHFGVQLYKPVDFYNLVNRAAKYGVLFVSLAFMAVFVLELTSGQRVHAVQYLFVGLTMTFFYVLLLSFSEQIGFALAYLIASAASGGMLSLYVGMAFRSRQRGVAMLAVFGLLYGLLYLILNLEDYALLAGAILGFVALTALMFTTLRIDWSGEAVGSGRAPREA